MTEQPVGPRCGNNPNVRLTPGDRKAVDDFEARLALQASAQPYIDSAAWVDGDPLMEVIADTLWKHCARDDEGMPQLVCDDPRTIAAFAAAVARAHAAAPSAGLVSVPPTTTTADLVDVAAQAIRDSNGSPEALEWWRTHPQLIPAHVYAAAVLRELLPAGSGDTAATRAAVLQDLIAKAEGWDGHITVQELRRLAAETQPDEARPRRGDAVECWLKAQRDEYHQTTGPQWIALDEALDTYRLHADMGVPLGGHVCEGRAVGDCECLEEPAAVSAVGQTDEEA
jgi:hypothetical protein